MKDELRRPERLMWVMMLISVFLVITSGILFATSQALSVIPSIISSTVLWVLWLLVIIQVYFTRRQGDEEVAVEDYKAGHAGNELFADSDEGLKHVSRTLKIYTRYVLPVFVVLLGALVLLVSLMAWQSATAMPVLPTIRQPLRFAALCLSLSIGCMVIGSYYAGASRERYCRWLRPVASWVFFSGFTYAIAAVAMLLVHLQVNIQRLDVRGAKIALAFLLLLGAEQIINVVIEFYRPRVPGEADRPVVESRLLSLLTEPGGVAGNVAAALDYQFGFQVSEVWFYRFLERTLVKFVLFMALLFWLMTMLVVIKPEEQGIRVRQGRVLDQAALKPRHLPYVKLPWPFETIVAFPVDRVQSLDIGYIAGDGKPKGPPAPDMEMGDMTGRVMVWSKAHHAEETNFVVAMKPDEESGMEGIPGGTGASLPVSVSFISASIPLYFKVTDLYAYLFQHRDTRHTLEEMATREVVRYLANVDFNKILSVGRGQGGLDLRERIQRAADAQKLGIEIVAVGLQGLHPPVRVGRSFDGVVGAMEERHSDVLRAEKEAFASIARAEGDAMSRISEAKAYSNRKIQVAQAESLRFEKQLNSYRVAPQLYVLYSFLDVLESEGKGVRKFVVAADQGQEVLVFNLEKKARPDLLDLDLGTIEKK